MYGLGGAGDLHVTAVAGRNRIFGELRGAGLATRTVVRRLARRDELTEGYAAIRWCWRFAAGRGVEVPLLRALHRIVYGGRDVERELRAACWSSHRSPTSARCPSSRRSPMRRTLAVLLAAGLLAGAQPAAAQGPIIAQFWYSFGGKNREVTEAHIKKFNESQTQVPDRGHVPGRLLPGAGQDPRRRRTKTAPAVFHVVGEAIPQLGPAGLFEPLEAYATGPNGTNLADYPPRPDPAHLLRLPRQAASRRSSRCRSSAARPSSTTTPTCWRPRASRCPTTWDELRAAAGKLTVREGSDVKVYGFEVPVDWWFWYALLHQAGGTLVTPDGKKAAFREKGTEALQFWVDLVNKDKTHEAAARQGLQRLGGDQHRLPERQRVAMIFTSTAFLNYITENAKFKVGTAFLPGKVEAGGADRRHLLRDRQGRAARRRRRRAGPSSSG